MNVASLAFPGPRALAGWWRQLAPLRPAALWVGYLHLHRVEALACLERPGHVDALGRLVLRAVELEQAHPNSAPVVEHLSARLHLDQPLLRQLLAALARDGLLEQTPGAAWRLTDVGRQALPQGDFPRPTQERRVFHFVEALTPAARPPHFLHLTAPGAQPWQPDGDWEFDVGVLTACVARPLAWKEHYGFPADVRAVVTHPAEPTWRDVIVDHPERLAVVLAQAASPEGSRLLAFAVRTDGWVLQAMEPVFAVKEEWPEAFPELARDPGPDVWREAWLAWCQPRGIAPDEAADCTPERVGERLRVTVPARVIERLRAARSDALKGEAWLLVGDGAVRWAVVLELVERAG